MTTYSRRSFLGVALGGGAAAIALGCKSRTTGGGPLAATGRFEQFETSDRFDGTKKNRKWLEAAVL